ncbi:MAG: DNA alkylation repair protein [Alloprevotella sp.]|nr:DNA alkylation repair protein [Bacteroidales bacterium]MDY3944037.1 DNA alkylation repair protein [Alloprevotella sp.]
MTGIALQEWLRANAEPALAAFNAKLLPNCEREILGIRVPKLRSLAKELARDWPNLPPMGNTQEEALLYCYVLGQVKIPFSQLLKLITDFLPEVNNWAICDALCTVLKSFKRYDREGFDFLLPYCSSPKAYEQRFVMVMFLTHYVRSAYIDRIIDIFIHIEPQGYYVKMAVGWALATCYVKYPDKIESALCHARINEEVRQMAIQKILESRHTDDTQRQRILRIRNR